MKHYQQITLSIDKRTLREVLNPMFKTHHGVTLQEWLLQEGYTPIGYQDPCTDVSEVHYRIAVMGEHLIDFLHGRREGVRLQAECLGYITDPTHEELETLVPDYFPDAKGRKFRDYLVKQEDGKALVVDGLDLYPVHCNNHLDSNSVYSSRNFPPSQDDMWAFIDFFGYGRYMTASEVTDLINKKG